MTLIRQFTLSPLDIDVSRQIVIQLKLLKDEVTEVWNAVQKQWSAFYIWKSCHILYNENCKMAQVWWSVQDIIHRDLEKWSEISTVKDKKKCWVLPIESANPYCGDTDRRASHNLKSLFNPFRTEGWALRSSLSRISRILHFFRHDLSVPDECMADSWIQHCTQNKGFSSQICCLFQLLK